MIKNKLMNWAGLFIAVGLLPLSAMAQDEGGDNWSISGWINEALIYYDDGNKSDIVQASDNGTTLGSRITLAGSTELENSGLDAGFEVILEPLSNETPLINLNQDDDGHTGANIGVLGTSGYVGGAFGKLTVGLQSMPTDNIAVLADPSLTLWSSISPVFRGNGFFLQDGETRSGAVWGNFLNCYTAGLRGAAGIGLDCNGIYRNGIRYDLPTFHEDLSIGISYANDDVFDIAFKFKTDLGRMKFLLYAGYAENHSIDAGDPAFVTPNLGDDGFVRDIDGAQILADGTVDVTGNPVATPDELAEARTNVRNTRFGGTVLSFDRAVADLAEDIADPLITEEVARDAFNLTVDGLVARARGFGNDGVYYDEADNLQIQLGLMDPVTGIFGTLAYQDESADLDDGDITGDLDGSDAWWLKVGIKKAFTSIGDTALTFQYGQYNDQYGLGAARAGVTGSEVQRVGFSVDQYFGSRLIIYGAYENLDLDIDGNAVAQRVYGGVDELDLFTAGMTFFF